MLVFVFFCKIYFQIFLCDKFNFKLMNREVTQEQSSIALLREEKVSCYNNIFIFEDGNLGLK